MRVAPRQPMLITLAAAVLLPLVFMGPTLLLNRPLTRDDASLQFYPQFAGYAQCLKANDLYLWDPEQFCGLPALGTAQSGGLYPPHLLAFRLLPWQSAVHLCYWLHLSLSILAFVWVARNLGAAWSYALLGAIIYTFSGFQAAHLIHYNFITALAHLPLLLAVLQTALTRGAWRWWGLLSLELALAFLSSQPQLFLMSLFVALLWVIGGGWRRETDSGQRSGRVVLGRLGVTIVVAVLLVLPQLLPELELTRLTQSIGTGQDALSFMASYPFRLVDIPRVIFPSLYGTINDSVTGSGPVFHETSAFVGAGVLVLGAAGLVLACRRRDYGFLVLVLLAGLLLIPAGNPIYRLVAHVPLISGFRAMGRWAILPIFSLAMLASLGLTALPEVVGRKAAKARTVAAVVAAAVLLPLLLIWATFGMEGGAPAIPGSGATIPRVNVGAVFYKWLVGWEPVLALLGAALALAALYVMRSRRACLALALIATTLPLWHYWQTTYQPGPVDYYARAPRTAQVILQRGGGRMTTLPPELVNADDAWRTRGGAPDPGELSRELLSPVFGLPFGLAYSDGYRHRLTTPSTYRLWEHYFRYGSQAFTGRMVTSAETLETFGTAAERMKRMHRLCGVQFIVTPGSISDPDLEVVHEGSVRVYQYRRLHPQAWLTGTAIVARDPEAQLAAIKQRDFDPDLQTVVDADAPGLTGEGVTGTAVMQRRNNQAVVTAQASAPALLVLADAWYPGWRAYVDGQPAPLLRANYAFRAVAVPAGKHEVVFRYQPTRWLPSLVLMAVGIVGVLLMVRRGR